MATTGSLSIHRKRLTLLAMCLGLFLVQTDTTAVNLALPAIGRTLRGSLADQQWVLDAYNLTFAALLLTGGTLGDRYGRRRLFCWGASVFLLGSVACALAPTLGVLIAGRTAQGVGAALAIPQSLAILSVVFPERAERNRAMAAWSTVAGVALAAGPTLGGLLVDRIGWQSIFWINVPIGLAALVLASRAVPESAESRPRTADPLGQLLAIGFLATLTFAVVRLGQDGPTSPTVLGAAAASLACLVGFLASQRRGTDPMLPLGLLRGRLGIASVVAGCMTFGMYGLFLLISLDLQGQHGIGAFATGLWMLPIPIVMMIGSPITARLVNRFGPRPVMTTGMALMGASLLGFATLGAGGPLAGLEVVFGAAGLGLALNTGPVVGVAMSEFTSESKGAGRACLIGARTGGRTPMSAVSADRAGLAAGIANLARMFGSTLGVAVLGAVLGAVGHQASSGPAFGSGLRAALLVGAVVELAGAVVAYRGVPGRQSVASPAVRQSVR